MEASYHILADITVPNGIPNASQKPCLFLVIPDTEYSSKTPVILGTNILNDYLVDCRNHFGQQYLQAAKLHTPWYHCFRAISLREKQMTRGPPELFDQAQPISNVLRDICITKQYNFKLISMNLLHKTNNMRIKLWDWSVKGVENIVKKGKNAGYQHFSFSKSVFKRLLSESHS